MSTDEAEDEDGWDWNDDGDDIGKPAQGMTAEAHPDRSTPETRLIAPPGNLHLAWVQKTRMFPFFFNHSFPTAVAALEPTKTPLAPGPVSAQVDAQVEPQVDLFETLGLAAKPSFSPSGGVAVNVGATCLGKIETGSAWDDDGDLLFDDAGV